MKEKCDNICETCTMQSQVYCLLMFAKANNQKVSELSDRITNVENKMGGEVTFLNPLQNSEIPPALEVEDNQNTNII